MGDFKNSDYYKSGKILENAKIGSILGSKKLIELKEERIREYNKKPKLCSFCEKELEYKKRNNKFCCNSCSAYFNNNKRVEFKNCENENCKKLFKPKKKNQRFCCYNCSLDENKKRSIENWKNTNYRKRISDSLKKRWQENRELFSTGEEHSKKVGKYTKGKYKGEITSLLDVSLRTTRKILKRLKLKCNRCGWDLGSCDIHHINGKKIENCNEHFNLTYVCPNCHRLIHEGKIQKSELISLDKILPENWIDLYFG